MYVYFFKLCVQIYCIDSRKPISVQSYCSGARKPISHHLDTSLRSKDRGVERKSDLILTDEFFISRPKKLVLNVKTVYLSWKNGEKRKGTR